MTDTPLRVREAGRMMYERIVDGRRLGAGLELMNSDLSALERAEAIRVAREMYIQKELKEKGR